MAESDKQKDIQRYDNPFERNNPKQMAADEKIIRDAAEKYGVQDTGAGSNIRNELERMRNKNYQRANPEELKVANAMNLGINAVGGNQFFTAQQPTFAEVRGDIRTRLGQDARNYGGGIKSGMSSIANAVLPGKMFEIANAGLKSLNSLSDKTKNLYSGTVDLFKKSVGTLNDIQEQIFMNPDKYKYARNQEEIINAEEKEDEVNRLETVNEKIEADRKQFEDLLNISVTDDYYGNLVRNRMQKDNAYKLDPPIGTENAPGGFTGLPGRDFASNAPGGIGLVNSQAYRDMLLDNYRIKEMGTGNMPGGVDPMGLPVQGDVTIDVNKSLISPFINETPIGELDTDLGIKSLNEFDVRSLGGNNEEPRDNNNAFGDEASNSITDYFNPGNLVDVGQAGTTGETYGENKFAIFNTVDDGLRALTKDLNKKVGDFDGDVEKIISKYASGDPNVNNYINFIKDKVGSTVEEDEIPTLVESVIAMENKPEIADQYLAYLQDNSNKIYSGIISS